jgi:hypothetical protein
MEGQVKKNEHFRRLLLYEFNRDSKAAEAARNICADYGEDSIAERTAQKWFARFKQGNFDMSDTPRSERHVVERNLTVTAERYFQQLLHLQEAIQQKRPGRHME